MPCSGSACSCEPNDGTTQGVEPAERNLLFNESPFPLSSLYVTNDISKIMI